MEKDGHRLRGSERDFLDWATAPDADPLIRYYATQAWDNLNEDSPAWRRRLEGFTRRDDPFMRLHALAALSRRGDAGRLAEVVEAAWSAEHVCVRAEALRILGELDATRHRALLHRAMMEPQTARCENGQAGHRAAFNEARRGVMRLDQPEALTELIQCYLAFPGLQNPGEIKRMIETLMNSGEVEELGYPPFEARWGRCRGERALHDWPDLLNAERRSGNRTVRSGGITPPAGQQP
jgi:hypothetical protein